MGRHCVPESSEVQVDCPQCTVRRSPRSPPSAPAQRRRAASGEAESRRTRSHWRRVPGAAPGAEVALAVKGRVMSKPMSCPASPPATPLLRHAPHPPHNNRHPSTSGSCPRGISALPHLPTDRSVPTAKASNRPRSALSQPGFRDVHRPSKPRVPFVSVISLPPTASSTNPLRRHLQSPRRHHLWRWLHVGLGRRGLALTTVCSWWRWGRLLLQGLSLALG